MAMSPKTFIKHFQAIETPFYFYEMTQLENNLKGLQEAAARHQFTIHYALKANSNDKIINTIARYVEGADCVSGNEIKRAMECGFSSSHIAFAGVGKSDKEIAFALENEIFSFNCESKQELEIINALAQKYGKKARIALRMNPNVNAHTHHYITTGLDENKFGINPWDLDEMMQIVNQCDHIELCGLHFHIGSQITDLSVFSNLCNRVNEIKKWFDVKNINIAHMNLGGGLGVNYREPDKESLTDFETCFGIIDRFLQRSPGQEVHLEPGRSVVAQCGSLISRVLYVKNGMNTNFVILDAGMTELIRPALYQSYHCIQNISNGNEASSLKYDVVGPICESSDCFGKAVQLPETHRGDFFAIRTAGAYGETMSSSYNLRDKALAIYSDELPAN